MSIGQRRAAVEGDERTDAQLVGAARQGDRSAFAALYDRYRRAVHAVALARVRAEDAGDVVQDAFLLALRRLPSLRDPAAFGGWLLMIARNRATALRRREQPRAPLPESLGRPSPPTAEAAQVLAAIRALPDAYSETLVMRLVEGMTGPEIAARTGLEPGSVRVNLSRGMKMLRAKLEGTP